MDGEGGRLFCSEGLHPLCNTDNLVNSCITLDIICPSTDDVNVPFDIAECRVQSVYRWSGWFVVAPCSPALQFNPQHGAMGWHVSLQPVRIYVARHTNRFCTRIDVVCPRVQPSFACTNVLTGNSFVVIRLLAFLPRLTSLCTKCGCLLGCSGCFGASSAHSCLLSLYNLLFLCQRGPITHW